MANFYILESSGESGPFTMGQVVRMWNDGKIKADAQFRLENSSKWQNLSDFISSIDSGFPNKNDQCNRVSPSIHVSSAPDPYKIYSSLPENQARCGACKGLVDYEAHVCPHCRATLYKSGSNIDTLTSSIILAIVIGGPIFIILYIIKELR